MCVRVCVRDILPSRVPLGILQEKSETRVPLGVVQDKPGYRLPQGQSQIILAIASALRLELYVSSFFVFTFLN